MGALYKPQHFNNSAGPASLNLNMERISVKCIKIREQVTRYLCLRFGKNLQEVQVHLKGIVGARTNKNRSFHDLIEVGLAVNKPLPSFEAQENHPELVSAAQIRK